jgi:hypothetical protein
VASASLEEHLGVGGGLGAELLQPGLRGGPHPEEPAEAAREPAEQAVGGAHAHQLPPHADVVLLEVGEAHPHARHLELELPVLAPHRRVVVPRRHGAAAGPEEERRLVPPNAAAAGAGLVVDRVAEAELLEVEHLHCHLHRQPPVLRRVAARVGGQPLAVDRLAQPVTIRLFDVRVHLRSARSRFIFSFSKSYVV